MELRFGVGEVVPRQPTPGPRELARLRRDFFERGQLPASAVQARILSSWQRCRAMGLDCERLHAPEPLSRDALDVALARSEALRMLAEPELEFLTETLADTVSVIILSDAKGLILDTRGDPGAMNRATREALLPGVSWSEEEMGTNAIGTALADNHLIEVWGGEHYHELHRRICCTAAPILDHTSAIAGLLDVSGDARLPRGYARSLVKRAVREIEHRWLLNAPQRLARLCFHPGPACLGSYVEGVLLLDDERIVGANRAALKWLQRDWSLVGKSLGEVFELRGLSHSATALRTLDGITLYASLNKAHPRSTGIHRTSASDHPANVVSQTGHGRVDTNGGDGAWLSAAHSRALERTCRAIAAGLSTVILGETGAGKEIFARRAHAGSNRASQPFVAINCAALPESLIEAELFGYREGAFTGANRKGAPGRIAEADGGILFLDEIGDMPLALQARLLRVLQDRQVVPLGGGAPRAVDCVVLCATHRDLQVEIDAGRFRADLFYRLRDHQVELPAWRDLPPVDREQALARMWDESGGPARGMQLTAAAWRSLLAYHWPGNFRQLASVLRTLVALGDAGQRFDETDLPTEIRTTPTVAASLETLEDAAIRDALARHGGKIAPAARELGIHRATLYRRLDRMRSSDRK